MRRARLGFGLGVSEDVVPVVSGWDEPFEAGIVLKQRVTGLVASGVVVESAMDRVTSFD